MKNIMEIDGQKAVISFDPDIGLFRGEFLGLSGGADFYAADVEGLLNEGRASLEIYLKACEERGSPHSSTSREDSMSGSLRSYMRTLSVLPRLQE